MKITKEYLSKLIRESIEEIEYEPQQEMPQGPTVEEAEDALELVSNYLKNTLKGDDKNQAITILWRLRRLIVKSQE